MTNENKKNKEKKERKKENQEPDFAGGVSSGQLLYIHTCIFTHDKGAMQYF